MSVVQVGVHAGHGRLAATFAGVEHQQNEFASQDLAIVGLSGFELHAPLAFALTKLARRFGMEPTDNCANHKRSNYRPDITSTKTRIGK